jgi:hypothetical protein
MTRLADELRLDGNAAGGLLAAVFAFDVTRATTACEGCGRSSVVGELMLYAVEMGAVLRCPGCDHMMMCATDLGGVVRLDMRGVKVLVLPLPPWSTSSSKGKGETP